MVKSKGNKDIIRRGVKHCFANQFLDDHGTELYRGTKQILKPVGKIYNIKLPNTTYYVGERLIQQGETKNITSYEILREMGFVITSRKVTARERWEHNQVVIYELKRASEVSDHLNSMPAGKFPCYVEMDPYNKVIRLVGIRAGRMGFGPWIDIYEKKEKRNYGGVPITYKGYGKNSDEIIDNQMREWLDIDEDPEPIAIKEAAFMITDSNEIVCFPALPDMPSILVTGMKGCLTKDSLIDMPRDLNKYPKGVPMADLLDKKNFYVYSYNIQKNILEVKRAQSCEYSETTDVYEIELINGQKIRATGNHPFLLMDGTYKKLKDLKWSPGKSKYVWWDKNTKTHTQTDRLRMFSRLTTLKRDNIIKGRWSGGVIKEIRYVGKEKVYDIVGVEDNKNYIANGFVCSNTGKSFALHSLVDRFFWKPAFDYKITILNDSSRETGTWCLPNSDNAQRMMLKKLNERPLPLPTVYLHPKVKEDYETLYLGSTGFFITIPFKEVVENHKMYLKIEGSARYFTKFKEQLKNCSTQQEAEALLDTIKIAFQVPNMTANKIVAEFETLFDTKMTDISSEKQEPWSVSKVPEKYYNPLTACVHAGVLPVLETEYVSNLSSMLSIYFTYFVSDLFMRQKQDPNFIKERSQLLFVIDEVHHIAKKGVRSGADFLLRRCVREGRPRRIGTLLATQKFQELPDVIKDNSMYLLCFKNPGEATAIANQYKMGKGVAQMITDLDKHECVAYTTEHFIIYDSYGNRRKSRPNETFRGRVLPPFSEHKRPRAKGG